MSVNDKVTYDENVYNEDFYRTLSSTTYRSAVTTIEFVSKYLPHISSVVDVGCGVGQWLRAWQNISIASSTNAGGGGGKLA